MSFINRFCLTDATVAASIPYYESKSRLSRRTDNTDIFLENYLLITYEKALFIQAELRKFRRSTIERKQMSTKTTFKRIALVAVAALGLGVISVAPSQASVIGLTVTSVNGTATTATSDSTTAATLRVTFTATAASDSATITSYVSSKPSTAGAIAGSGIVTHLLDTTTSTVLPVLTNAAVGATSVVRGDSTTVVANINSATTGQVSANFAYYLLSAPTVAGTYTITTVVTPFSTGVAGTPVAKTTDIVVTASAADSKVASAATSTAFLSAGASSANSGQSVDSAVAVVSTASAADIAEVNVILKNANGTASKVVESVTATITGPGTIGSGGVYGKSITVAYTAAASVTFGVRADGTAGTASIAISTPSVTFAAKSLTFYAKAAKTITAAVDFPTLAVGANADAVSATAVDANGATWSGAMYIYASDTAAATVAGSQTPVACSWSSADAVHYCPVTGNAVGTAKLKLIDASTVALATATSNEITVTVSAGTPASIKLAFDKATYAPFEKAKITVTPLDKDGKAIAAQTDKALLATGGITSTFAFSAGSDTLTATTVSTDPLTGAKTYTVYMPAASGDVVITATGGAAVAPAGQVKVTATATVVNSSVDAATDAANEATDAANEATDAANAATDAALAAADAATAAAQDASDAVAALSATVAKLVASLKAQITSLTNLVIKIQKKVKA